MPGYIADIKKHLVARNGFVVNGVATEEQRRDHAVIKMKAVYVLWGYRQHAHLHMTASLLV
jgi:hypothetical protein